MFKVDTFTKRVRSHSHDDDQGGGDIMKEAAKHPTAVQVCGDILDHLQVINMMFSNQVGFVLSLTRASTECCNKKINRTFTLNIRKV